MTNKKFNLKRKSFNTLTDSLDGLLVFDPYTHKIYLAGDCFSSNVKDVSFNQTTGVITLTKMNGTAEIINLSFEKYTNKVTSISDQSTDDEYPSAKCIYGTLENKGEIVWEAQTVSDGILATETDLSQSPTWQLTNIDMTPYQTVYLYIRSGGTGADTTASGVIRVNLANMNLSPFGYFIGSTVLQNPNNRNRLLALSVAVSKDKTKVLFNRCTSLYNTAATDANSDGRVLYKIVGYRGTGTPEPSGHTLVIVAPDHIIGEEGNVCCLYDDQLITPAYNITPTGPTINDGVITFDSNMSGTYTITASYQGLTASKRITLEYVSGGSTDIEVNPDGSITTTTTTENPDGSTQIDATTENPDGTSTSQSTTNNTDGSSQSTTTNYDENGNPTDTTNQDTDTTGSVSTQNIVYDEDGNAEVIGYNIDTSESTAGGKTIEDGVDTGVLAFDGRDWEATLKCEMKYADLGANEPIISLTYRNPDNNNKVEGLVLIVYPAGGGTTYDENDQKLDSGTSNTLARWRANEWYNGSIVSSSSKYMVHRYNNPNFTKNQYLGTRSASYTFTYKFKCINNVVSIEIYDQNDVLLSMPRNKATFNMAGTATDITIEVGVMENNAGTKYLTKMNVISFNVTKL